MKMQKRGDTTHRYVPCLLFLYFSLTPLHNASPASLCAQEHGKVCEGSPPTGKQGPQAHPFARTWHAQAAQVCPSLSFLLFLIFSPLCESDGVQADEELMTLASITCHLK